MSTLSSTAPLEPPAHPFSQTASFANAAPLFFKNALLAALTLTLFRFWARTDVRRRLWVSGPRRPAERQSGPPRQFP